MKIAFQMEPMEKTNRLENNTLLLMEEAQNRGYEVFHFEPQNVSISNDKIFALANPVKLNLKNKEHYKLGKAKRVNLSEMDVIMIRQDPPFDMNYITNTYMLEKIGGKTIVVNNPAAIRDLPEKIYPLNFKKFIPPTIITYNKSEIEDFRKKHKDIVLKPLYNFHGNGVMHIKPGDNYDKWLKARAGEPVIAQKFIPEIREGNKRVVFLNGEVAGAIITVPQKGEFRIYRGSSDHKYKLNKRDKEICKAVGADLKRRGLVFVGIDIIGDYLTEINTTSVGTIRRINKLYGGKFESKVWDAVVKKYMS